MSLLRAVALAGAVPGLRTTSHMNTQTLRHLNDIAMTNSAATLALQAHDGTVRSMHCEPTLPGPDSSGRYVIVRDTWLSAKCGRPMFRRVDLETIVGVQMADTAVH